MRRLASGSAGCPSTTDGHPVRRVNLTTALLYEALVGLDAGPGSVIASEGEDPGPVSWFPVGKVGNEWEMIMANRVSTNR